MTYLSNVLWELCIQVCERMHACVCACVLVQPACKQVGVAMRTCMRAKSLQSSLTLCDPVDYSLPGSSVHGFSKQEYCCGLPCPPSRGSSRPRDRTWVSCIAGRFFTIWATREAPCRAITPIKFLSRDHSLNTKMCFRVYIKVIIYNIHIFLVFIFVDFVLL